MCKILACDDTGLDWLVMVIGTSLSNLTLLDFLTKKHHPKRSSPPPFFLVPKNRQRQQAKNLQGNLNRKSLPRGYPGSKKFPTPKTNLRSSVARRVPTNPPGSGAGVGGSSLKLRSIGTADVFGCRVTWSPTFTSLRALRFQVCHGVLNVAWVFEGNEVGNNRGRW